ncbi:MAG: MBL fold metallo-hydrolase [Eubacteriales bacterium]|nr:MBL fold metallo-hydrolase [Eubacteriales bacterium]
MKIHFYGTGASEGVPALFCECENCRRMRRLGGKNLRTRTGAKVDEELLIDFSADTYAHVLYGGLDLTKINYLLVTHSHEDHLYSSDLMTLKPPMAFYERERSLAVYGNEKTAWKIRREMEKYGRSPEEVSKYVRIHEIAPYEKQQIGEYEVIPLPANHDKQENCLIYVIGRGGKYLLYGHDTAMFAEEAWQALKQYRFDCVILDCTMVEETGIFPEHMGLPDNILIRERMLKEHMASEQTKFIATHFTHIYNPEHERITPLFAEKGLITAYDGMEVEF